MSDIHSGDATVDALHGWQPNHREQCDGKHRPNRKEDYEEEDPENGPKRKK